MTADPPHVGRRALLLAGAGVLLSACTRPGPTGGARSTGGAGSAGATPAASPPGPVGTPTLGPTVTPLPAAAAWPADPRDVRPEVKLAATRLVEALGTWGPGQSGAAAARARLSALGQDQGLVAAAGPVVSDAEASVLQVIEAQYGGILASTASVLVVTRAWTRDAAGAVTTGGATYDVRLVEASPSWRVTEIHPSDPGPAVTPSPLAHEVLTSERIDLPPASAADIASGQVHDSVLEAMLGLARTYRIGVSVVRSGHPTYVFGTSRLSDHPRGRAFDTWRIDGQAVVAGSTPQALVTSYMRDAAKAGSYNVGGPYALSGSAFFTDDTHHDHVHAGFAS
ncbi:hypothetical protein [Raineyella sp.]|uniref:hypothetical protein n=1 Tax=Raineyella sp. TaxID=1911550 RepID=UPI002B21983B|nr:hypothetical protein [Raineyella sp.]MEA5154430.1 hypothetical protein [Raineyella sp.]